VRPTETPHGIDVNGLAASLAKKNASPVSITNISLSSTSLTVDGANAALTATINNTGPSLVNAAATCTLTQKKTFHSACSTFARFGTDAGVLPTGATTVTIPIFASNDSVGQGTFVSGSATLSISIVVGSTQFAEQSVQVSLVPVAFFTNAIYTNFNPGIAEFSGSDMLAAVQGFGYTVAPFSTLDDATWAQATESQVLIIPELTHDLVAVMSAAQRQSVVDFVDRGGTLVTVITNTGFINHLFGTDMRFVAAASSPVVTLDARGTSFEGGPGTLQLNGGFNSGLQPATVPFQFLAVYFAPPVTSPNSSEFTSYVTVIRPRNLTFNPKGQIIVLGWNWLNAAPVGNTDGGWNDVLHRAIRFASSSF
jgi:hypothetical protein